MALIKCPNCGKDISERAITCINCGVDINNSKKNKEYKENKKTGINNSKKKKMRSSISFGILAGIIMLVVGAFIIYSCEDTITSFSRIYYSHTYGADFYSEQSEANTKIVNNLHDIGKILYLFIEGFGVVISAMGIVVICYFNNENYKERKLEELLMNISDGGK